MKKVCLFGASGFVGTNILIQMSGEFDFTAFSRSPNVRNLPCRWIQRSSSEWPLELSKILKEESISAIIFCSGSTNLSEKVLKEIYDSLLSSLLRILEGTDIKLIFFSAGSAERDKSLFASMNLKAEEKIKSSGVDHFILRPSLIYGPYDNKNLTLIFKLIKSLPLMPMPKKGQVMLQPVHTDDICSFIKKCLDRVVQKNKIYTLAGSYPVDLVLLAEMAAGLSGKKPIFFHLDLNLIKKIFTLIPFMPTEQVANSQEKANWDNSDFSHYMEGKITDYKSGIKSLLDAI